MPLLNTQCDWIDIMEYSHREKVSLSTIRRRIKSGKIQCVKKEGKYYIYSQKLSASENKKMLDIEQENLELKMLLNIYEQKLKMIL
jgi:hypothetical protein